MKTITQNEITAALSHSDKIRKVAVENVAFSMNNCTDYSVMYANMELDKSLYKWNGPTWTALMKLYNFRYFDKKFSAKKVKVLSDNAQTRLNEQAAEEDAYEQKLFERGLI